MDLIRTVVMAATILLFMLSLGYAFADSTPPAASAQTESQNTPPSKEVQEARRKAAVARAFLARAAQGTTGCLIKPVMTDPEIERCRRAAYRK